MFEEAHTEAWRDIHASAMHEACTHHHTEKHTCHLPAAFHHKMKGTARHCLLTRPRRGAAKKISLSVDPGNESSRLAPSFS